MVLSIAVQYDTNEQVGTVCYSWSHFCRQVFLMLYFFGSHVTEVKTPSVHLYRYFALYKGELKKKMSCSLNTSEVNVDSEAVGRGYN